MATTYRWTKTITVEVTMADTDDNHEGVPVEWGEGEQEASAREYRDDAVGLFADAEEWVKVNESEWEKQ